MTKAVVPRLEMENIWTKIVGEETAICTVLNKLETTLMGGLGVYNLDGRFFSGLVPAIVRATNAIVLDKRKEPAEAKPVPAFVDRYYQRDAVLAGLKHKRGIIKIPTGGGKTRTAAGLLGALNCRWLYLVHKANLVESAAASFKSLLKENIGRVHGGITDPNHRVVCATFKSLAAKPELLQLIQSVDGIIVDEAHTLPAKEAFSVVLSATNAYYRIGLGATPLFREDHRDLHTIALLGPEIYSISPETLAKDNYVVLPSVEWINCNQKATLSKYPEVYNELISTSRVRNNMLINKLLSAPKPAIVFVKHLEHQNHVVELLKRYGAKSFAFVRGDTDIAERGHVVDRMIRGDLDIVVSSSVFNEGMDAPNLRTVMNATGSSSWIAAIQEPGRGTRPSKGKDSFKMYDFNDSGNKWFEFHTAQRYAAYVAAGYTVPAPSQFALQVLDSISERSSMLEPKAYAAVQSSVWPYVVAAIALLCLLAFR